MFIPGYLREREIDDYSAFYLKGRPVWGPHLYSLALPFTQK